MTWSKAALEAHADEVRAVEEIAKAEAEQRIVWCRRCERYVPIPAGWNRGAAVRRHYWRAHPEQMGRQA